MNNILQIALSVVATFILLVVIFRVVKGYYPASNFIIEDPPMEHNGLDEDQARFMFFYTTWCPWSVKAQTPWKSFKQMLKNNPTKFGGKTILFEEINAEADKGKAALYNVKQYPTFKLETSKKVFVLEGVPDPATFDVFLKGTLGEKSSS
jgi:hypothetical protein